MQEELPEGKNKAIIHNNAGYVGLRFTLLDLSVDGSRIVQSLFQNSDLRILIFTLQLCTSEEG